MSFRCDVQAIELVPHDAAIKNQIAKTKKARKDEHKAVKWKEEQMGLYLTSGMDDSLFLTDKGEEAREQAAADRAEENSEVLAEMARTRAEANTKPLWEHLDEAQSMAKEFKKTLKPKPIPIDPDNPPIKLIKLNPAFAALGEDFDY